MNWTDNFKTFFEVLHVSWDKRCILKGEEGEFGGGCKAFFGESPLPPPKFIIIIYLIQKTLKKREERSWVSVTVNPN